MAIRVPSVAEEAVRDQCRARADLVDDRDRARKRLLALLLRHSRVYRAGSYWTGRHLQWLAAQCFDEPALDATFGHYRAVLDARDAAVAAIDADLRAWFDREPFADAVARLGAYRGVAHLGALTLASEVCDWRRFARATTFMGFTGLVSSEEEPCVRHGLQGRRKGGVCPAPRTRRRTTVSATAIRLAPERRGPCHQQGGAYGGVHGQGRSRRDGT